MFVDLEGLESSALRDDTRDRMSDTELSYIQEAVDCGCANDLVARIDELSDRFPPKAIDSDRSVSDLIEPVMENIPNQYLEAPSDNIQIEEAAEVMKDIEGLSFDEWKELSLDERKSVLQHVENSIANIAHREVCPVCVKSMEEGHYGYFSPSDQSITVNSRYLESDSYEDYKECLDTIVHEGRHAYQDYNLNVREVHPREGDLTNWKVNENQIGYQDAATCGLKEYWMQPVEADARSFAEDVIKKYLEK